MKDEYCTFLESFSPSEEPIEARTVYRAKKTKSLPVLVKCSDSQKYWIKGFQAGRQIVNDHIIARIGIALKAPVGTPRLINVTQGLIDLEESLSHFQPGIAHGSLLIEDCNDEYSLYATDLPENRLRLARLALLYGWFKAGDPQYLYNRNPPRLIHSVDHGHFFPGGPNWTEENLKSASPAIWDECIASKCRFTHGEIVSALDGLACITNEQLFEAVAILPDSWQLTMEEQFTLIEFLHIRQQDLLSGYSVDGTLNGGDDNG